MLDRWSRRQVVQGAVGLGLLAGCGRLPGQAAGPAKVYRVRILTTTGSPPDSPNIQAFHQGLRELGYVDGRTIISEYRHAAEEAERAQRAAELLQLGPDVIVVSGGNPAIRAAQGAT